MSGLRTGTSRSRRRKSLGLYVTVPIFNGFALAYGVRQAQAALQASEAKVDQARLQVSLGVWNAYYAFDSANQQLGATAQLTQTAEKNQQVGLGRYQSGVGTIIDVLTEQSAASSARLLRISAEFGWQVTRAQFAPTYAGNSRSDAEKISKKSLEAHRLKNLRGFDNVLRCGLVHTLHNEIVRYSRKRICVTWRT